MAKQGSVVMVLGLLVLLNAVPRFSASNDTCDDMAELKRSDFPQDFTFGASSASYQYEGAAYEGGKGKSNWDNFTLFHPEKIKDHSNANVTVDFYHRYKDDVSILNDTGMNAFRFSIAWSRILPRGKVSGGINFEGIEFYNNLTNELVAYGIEPYVTLFHWDLPQALEDEYDGFLHENIIDDFRDYAEVCFIAFGDRVKNWITLNEPYTYTTGGYVQGTKPPLRCSKWEGNCSVGDSATEPYKVTHNLLLAHAAAVKVYKDKYQPWQKGKIGISLNCFWMVPISDASADEEARARALDFMFGWYMEPLVYGHYPTSMQDNVGERLPKFNQTQSDMVKGSFDFVGLNYYTARYVADISFVITQRKSFTNDSYANLTTERNGKPIGKPTGSSWLYVYPVGLYDMLMYIKHNYSNPVIYITENGVFDNTTDQSHDQQRIDYYNCHLKYLRKAIKKKVKVKGYLVWSLMDNFEWNAGYTAQFGMYEVNYTTEERIPRASAISFKNFLHGGVMNPLKISPYYLHST